MAEVGNPTVVLKEAESWRQIAVGAALVARMQPNFQLFCEVTAHDGAALFGNLLGLVWEYAAGINTAIDFEKQREKLEPVTPDPNAFDMYGVWPALDASVALAALLSCCEQFDAEEVQSIVALSRATIGGFLEATEGKDDPAHPLYLMEEDFLLEMVSAALEPGSRRGVVTEIRKRAAAAESSNIGLSRD